MPLAPNTSARRGPMPFTYWTEVDNSSISGMLAGEIGEELLPRPGCRSGRQRGLLSPHASPATAITARAFPHRRGTRGGRRFLPGSSRIGQVGKQLEPRIQAASINQHSFFSFRASFIDEDSALLPAARTADSSRDKAALRNDNPLGGLRLPRCQDAANLHVTFGTSGEPSSRVTIRLGTCKKSPSYTTPARRSCPRSTSTKCYSASW